MKSPVNDAEPKIHPSVFVAPTAIIIGDVEIGEGTNIWFGAVIRAEMSKIIIGKNCSIQENCVIHTEPGTELHIGDNVLMGHCAMVHGPGKIGDNVMVGIAATVLQGHDVAENVVIAAGGVARGKLETMGMYAGEVVAKRKKELKKRDIRALQAGITFYVDNGVKFKATLDQEK